MGGEDDFGALVHQLLTADKRLTVQGLADAMGMKYDTLYARLIGRVSFRPREIQRLMRVWPDQRVIDYFLSETPYVAVERTAATPSSESTLHRSATRSVLEISDVLRAVEDALNDGRVDHQDKMKISTELDEAERTLAALRHQVTKG